MKNQIISYCEETVGSRFDFSVQESAEGIGHSIYQVEGVVNGEPILITLGDMLFEGDTGTSLRNISRSEMLTPPSV